MKIESYFWLSLLKKKSKTSVVIKVDNTKKQIREF